MRGAATLPAPALSLAALLACGALACGASEEPAAPLRAPFVVNFPSVAAAVAAETLEIQVFPLTEPELCQDLVLKRASGQALPKREAEVASVTPCELAAGSTEAALELPNGDRAVLVTAKRGGEDFLVGCGVIVLAPGVVPRPVSLTLAAPTVSVPATTCSELSEHCGGRC